MKRILTIVLLAVCAGGLQAQENKFRTDGMSNGRVWVELTSAERVTYVCGIFIGLQAAGMFGGDFKSVEKQFFTLGTTPAGAVDFVREMNGFFADSKNLDLPICIAYTYANSKLVGTSTERELREWIEAIRRIYLNSDKPRGPKA